jgi:1-acyl-sn-glycerol-3-phosphate acyltransferase
MKDKIDKIDHVKFKRDKKYMRENMIFYNFLKCIYATIITIFYNPKVYGKENIPKDGPIILAGNHRHAFDAAVVMTHTKRFVHYMAKESLCRGILGFFLRQIGVIKVYRSKSNPDAIVEAENILKNGGTIGIFPEGTRNKELKDELLEFKHGAVVIAKNAGSKIVPFYINGKYKLFRRKLEIHFGTPIDVSEMNIDDANNYLRDEVLKLINNKSS